MTKSELISAVANEAGFSKKDTETAIEALETVVIRALKADDKIKIIKGLSLETKVVPAHVGRNPKTGESVNVPEKKKICVTVTPTLKKVVNE